MVSDLPPGPPLPTVVQTAAYFLRPLTFLGACHRRYGDRFTIRLAGMGPLVYLVDPADVRGVFRGDPDTFRAGEANSPLAELLGPRSVLVTDGTPHAHARKRMTPAFHGAAVTSLAPTMTEVAESEVATWPDADSFAVHPRTTAIALEIILRAVLGTTDPVRLAELRRVLPPLVDVGALATLAILDPRLLRFWPWRRQLAVRAEADRVLRDEIARTRRDPNLGDRVDILAALVRAADRAPVIDEDPDGELRDQLATLLMAGHETTATSLAWTVERLVREPDVLARARAAADTDGPEADRYLDAVVTESLRVRPVVSDVMRRLSRPAVVGGGDGSEGRWVLELPAGVVVTPAIALIQRDPRHHADPERFRPERHLQPDGSVRPDPLTWLPFGGGIRRCLGAAFATQEMRIVLRAILRAVELVPTDAPSEAIRARHVTLAPGSGATVTVRRRMSVPTRRTSASADTSQADTSAG